MARFRPHGLAWLVITGVLLLGSPGGAGAVESARVGREFKVKVGQVVTLERGGLRLKFREVSEDSRCPVGVVCMWAGNAEVMLEVGARGAKRTLKLNTNASLQKAGEGSYRRYKIKLVELNPRPSSERKIAAGEYTATLLVVKE